MNLARRVCARLQAEGRLAYLVGGCVRDLLLGREPMDYDVATDARPESIVELFPVGHLVGAHFGVVLVKEGDEVVEVATFRSDGVYSDGRRPDSVQFEGGPEADARRRDFTINGLFLDPATDQVLDFVGGEPDLHAGVIRAIGDPRARFAEDHLRLLRAVRFAARFGFRIEPATADAIREGRVAIRAVAVERVRDELDRILTEGGDRHGVGLLIELGLLAEIVPEASEPYAGTGNMAGLLHGLGDAAVSRVMGRLRFSNEDIDAARETVAGRRLISELRGDRPAVWKRFLRGPHFDSSLALFRALGGDAATAEWWEDRRRDAGDLFPAPLIDGSDLIAAGYPPGPAFSRALTEVESAQLEGRASTRDDAMAIAGAIISGDRTDS